MVIYQERSLRKPSGGRIKAYRKKKQYYTGSNPTLPRIEEKPKYKIVKTYGGNVKVRTMAEQFITVFDSKDKKTKKVKMNNIVDNKANKLYVRRNILTKGAVVETELGKAVITTRPAQSGSVQGKLLQ
ncbi:30S ribosomal protein S8e [Candidatus Woesearchaeota archaeon]|nr:30S ribosomal protein S8e [Candidatus Woesearchaeota archaeon]